MTQTERHERIIRQLADKKQVLVKDLAREFSVTEDCIRKDLTQLEKAGQLKRVHGGAISIRSNFYILKARDRAVKDIEEKRAIARGALDMIEEGQTIFLGISSTTLELARLLMRSGKKVTVVTNMISIMTELGSDENQSLYFIGGSLNSGRDGFVGSLADSQIRQFNYDVAFLGAVGIDVVRDQVMTYAVEDGLSKQAVMQQSVRTILLAEKSKFEQDGTYNFARLQNFDKIITGQGCAVRKQAEALTEMEYC